MFARLGDLYALLLGWPSLVKVHKGLQYLSGRALGLANYRSASLSGERHALRITTVDHDAPVVFDVGANRGQWSADLLRLKPHARVHAFEPQAALAAGIASALPQVTVNVMGLGDVPGSFELADYSGQEGSEHASLLRGVIDGIHHGNARYTTVPVGTVDTYCEEHAIARIDLLKIDVEGFEMKVLQGSRRMLDERRIRAIQFEFNEMNVVARSYMTDFFALLGATHDLYRLLPHGLLRLHPDNRWQNEQFVFQNVVALLRPTGE